MMKAQHSIATFARGFLLTALLSGGPALARGQASQPPEEDVPISRLEMIYLDCERAAVTGAMTGDDAMLCSSAYEELKRRAFAGDYQRLREWADLNLRRPELAVDEPERPDESLSRSD